MSRRWVAGAEGLHAYCSPLSCMLACISYTRKLLLPLRNVLLASPSTVPRHPRRRPATAGSGPHVRAGGGGRRHCGSCCYPGPFEARGSVGWLLLPPLPPLLLVMLLLVVVLVLLLRQPRRGASKP